MIDKKSINNKKIQLLPEHIIDQIKAGEVIERPASLIKELIENSIDANSSMINIHIINNGLDLISIEDDGHGMSYGELPYAFCRHATSKLERFEDLYNLSSYGFRGEALASISSIARVTCTTMPSNGESGGKIEIHGGQQIAHSKSRNNQSGTSIFIKDLFYNTPARLKFTKSKTSEKNAFQKLLFAFVLSNPSIKFSIKWDDKEKLFFKPVDHDTIKNRISQIFFKKNFPDKTLIEISGEYEGNKVSGYASTFSSTGNAGKSHFLFTNKRFFNDTQLHRAIVRSLDPIWNGASGHYMINISVPPSEVDVNVHPNKTQVKFLNHATVYSLLTGALKKSVQDHLKNQDPQPIDEGLVYTDQSQNAIDHSTKIEQLKSHGKSFFSYSTSAQESDDFNKSFDFENKVHDGQQNILDNNIFTFFKVISDGHAIAGIENDTETNLYAIDISKLIGHSISKKISNALPVSETEIIPLLISEPFSSNESNGIDKNFTTLKSIGFELDRLDSSTIVLRTMPDFMTFMPLRPIVESVIKQLEITKNVLSEENVHHFFETCLKLKFKDIDRNNIIPMLITFGIANACNDSIIIEINDQNITKLFK